MGGGSVGKLQKTSEGGEWRKKKKNVPDQGRDPCKGPVHHGGMFSLDRLVFCCSKVGCSGLAGGDLFEEDGGVHLAFLVEGGSCVIRPKCNSRSSPSANDEKL